MLEIGSVIDGKYKILSQIGQGGMSVVYLALNVYWEKQKFELPKLPPEYEWRCFADTALDGSGEENFSAAITEYWLHPRSSAVFVGVKRSCL